MESNPTFYSPSGNDAPAPPSGDRHAGSTPSVILRTIRTVFFFRPPPPCRLGAQKICTYAVAVLFSSKRFIGSSDHLQ